MFAFIMIYLPPGIPSELQAILAVVSSHLSSQTVPHSPSTQASTLPSLQCDPSISLMLPSVHESSE